MNITFPLVPAVDPDSNFDFQEFVYLQFVFQVFMAAGGGLKSQ